MNIYIHLCISVALYVSFLYISFSYIFFLICKIIIELTFEKLLLYMYIDFEERLAARVRRVNRLESQLILNLAV